MARAEMQLMFLVSLVANNNFFIQNHFRLDHFLFQFFFKGCSQDADFWYLCIL